MISIKNIFRITEAASPISANPQQFNYDIKKELRRVAGPNFEKDINAWHGSKDATDQIIQNLWDANFSNSEAENELQLHWYSATDNIMSTPQDAFNRGYKYLLVKKGKSSYSPMIDYKGTNTVPRTKRPTEADFQSGAIGNLYDDENEDEVSDDDFEDL